MPHPKTTWVASLCALLISCFTINARASQPSDSFFLSLDLSARQSATLALDQTYFTQLPESAYQEVLAEYVGREAGTRSGAKDFFSSNIAFFVGSAVRSCRGVEGSGQNCSVASASLLDSQFVLFVPWLEGRDTAYVGDSQIRVKSTKPSMILRQPGKLEKALGAEAQSLYRLTHYLGLAYLTNLLSDRTAPLANCADIMGATYRCDALDMGVMAFTGNLLQSMKRACLTCSSTDATALDMVSTHYLLRSKDEDDVRRGIALFSQHRESFRSVGISYEQLNEIYRSALTHR